MASIETRVGWLEGNLTATTAMLTDNADASGSAIYLSAGDANTFWCARGPGARARARRTALTARPPTRLIWAGVTVFFMQCGFGMLEAGNVRLKNTKNILLKNLLDACLGAIIWYVIGYAVAVRRPPARRARAARALRFPVCACARAGPRGRAPFE